MCPSHPCSDFDEWSTLAKTDPAAFEARRIDVIEDFIQNSPDRLRLRLRGLQFHIDMERRRARSPMGACVRLSRMMWDALLGTGGLRDALNGFAHGDGMSTGLSGSVTARVIPFKRPESF